MNSATAATVLALFLLAAAASVRGQAHLGDPSLCCFEYAKKPFPLKNILSYEYTNHKCTKPAVIFTTITNRRICANPQDGWTQQRVAQLSGSRP